MCADANANIIYGQIIDEDMKDAVRITVIATGFKQNPEQTGMNLGDGAGIQDMFSSTDGGMQQSAYQSPASMAGSMGAVGGSFSDEEYIPDFLKRQY